MGRPVNCRPDGIEIFEPAVGRHFVPHTAPDPLLGIQRRLITRQVVQPETKMGVQERLYLRPAVPARSIDVEPDRVPPEPAIEVAERHQEPGSIAPRRFHHAGPSQERRHPSGEIESLPVLAGGGDPQALPALAQPRPTRGCKVKPVSSWKTTVSRGPSSASFFYRPLEAARLGGPRLQVRVTGPFQAVAQLVHPHLGLPHLQPDPKLPL